MTFKDFIIFLCIVICAYSFVGSIILGLAHIFGVETTLSSFEYTKTAILFWLFAEYLYNEQ